MQYDDYTGDEYLGVGRPRPLPPELTTARQLVDAYLDARTDEDRAYAVDEAESFLFTFGDEVAAEVLATFLALPAAEDTEALFGLVDGCLGEHLPGKTGAVVRVIAGDDPVAAENALAFLGAQPPAVVARGLIAVLAGRHDDRVKGVAADLLVGLWPEAAVELFDAVEDHEVRRWVIGAAGCREEATTVELMRCICGRAAAS